MASRSAWSRRRKLQCDWASRPSLGLISFPFPLGHQSQLPPPDSTNALGSYEHNGPHCGLDCARALSVCLILLFFSTGECEGSAGPVTTVGQWLHSWPDPFACSPVTSMTCGWSCLILEKFQCEVIQTIKAMGCIVHVGLKHGPEVPERDLVSEISC